MKPSNILRIIAVYQTDDPAEHLVLFRVYKGNGQHIRYFVPKAWLHDLKKLLAEFDKIDAVLPPDPKQAKEIIFKAISLEPDAPRRRLTTRTGWVNEKTYVLPAGSFGTDTSKIRHRVMVLNPYQRRLSGSLKNWTAGIEQLCLASSFATFAIGIALTGPTLAFFTPSSGVVFNFGGQSGTGKTSTLAIANSVGAPPNRLGGLDVTQTGLEDLCFESNDGFLALDDMGNGELSTAGPRMLVKALAFSVRDGKGRQRSRAYGNQTGQETLSWRVAVLTNSETPLSAISSTGRKQGEEVRYIDVTVPEREFGGILDLYDQESDTSDHDAAWLISRSRDAAETNHSVCLEKFLRGLTVDVARSKKRVEKYCDSFCRKIREDATFDSIQDRYIEAFGKVYAALRLAIQYEAVPFTKAHAYKSVKQAFLRSELILGNEILVGQIVPKLLQHVASEKTCPVVKKGAKPVETGIWSFKRKVGKKVLVFLDPQKFSNFLGKENAKSLEGYFLSEGIQIRDSNGNSRMQLACSWLISDIKRPRLIVLDYISLNNIGK